MKKRKMLQFIETKPRLEDLDFQNESLTQMLNISIWDMPNLVFYGIPGCGKTTKIYSFLSSLLNTNEIYSLSYGTIEENRKEVQYQYSPYHIEFTPCDFRTSESDIFLHFLKDYVKHPNIVYNIPKIVYIKNANNLTYQSKMALRRIIEKSVVTTRYIFETSCLSSMESPLRSRLLGVRIPRPSIIEIRLSIKNYVENILQKTITKQEIDKCMELSAYFDYNLKHVYGIIMTYKYTGEWVLLHSCIQMNDLYEIYKKREMKDIHIEKAKEIMMELYIELIPMIHIIHYLYNRILTEYKNDIDLCCEVSEKTSKHLININKGNKLIIHMEYYFIDILESFVKYGYIK
jgi:replication factor C subunit 3/5